jgi:hypothetical protein
MKRQRGPLLISPSINQLTFIVRVLNSEEYGAELRKLVQAWDQNGPDLRKMLRNDQSLAASINRSICLLEPSGKGGKLIWMPRNAGKGKLRGRQAALSMFVTLVVHPELDKFASRPCTRCGNYFLKNSTRQKVYCSRRCGAYQNALLATREQRTKEHHKKLEKARTAIAAWKPSPAWRDWKRFVTAQTQLTAKFLTRAVNEGELMPPPSPAGPLIGLSSLVTALEPAREFIFFR